MVILSVCQNSEVALKAKESIIKNMTKYKLEYQNDIIKKLVDNYYSKLPPQVTFQPYKACDKALIKWANLIIYVKNKSIPCDSNSEMFKYFSLIDPYGFFVHFKKMYTISPL